MKKAKQKTLTDTFLDHWEFYTTGQPEYIREYRFVAKSDDPAASRYRAPKGGLRQWRFDVAWPEHCVAVELEGGAMSYPVKCDHCGKRVSRVNRRTGRVEQVYASMGGHTRTKVFQDNCEKYNAASTLGWQLLRFTAVDLRQRPQEVIEEIVGLLNRNSEETNSHKGGE